MADVNQVALVVSDQARDVIQFVVLAVMSSAVCLFGIVSNVVNIVVFYRQGLRSTVNISFLALSVADLCNAIITEWVSICFNSRFVNAPGLVFYPPDVSYLTGGFPHACLSRIAAWITVYMTAERCFCIAIPFKVKTLFTPRFTAVILIVIILFTMLPLIPEYAFFYLDWSYIPQMNRTLLGLVVYLDRTHLEGVSFLIYGVMMLTSFPMIIVLTIVLIVQLNKASHWRTSSMISQGQAKTLAVRERMVVRTVVVVACVLIVTFAPTVLFSVMSFAIPGFHLKGCYSNSYISLVAFAFFFDATNSSVNVILYYVTNTSFRKTFHEIMSLKLKSPKSATRDSRQIPKNKLLLIN